MGAGEDQSCSRNAKRLDGCYARLPELMLVQAMRAGAQGTPKLQKRRSLKQPELLGSLEIR